MIVCVHLSYSEEENQKKKITVPSIYLVKEQENDTGKTTQTLTNAMKGNERNETKQNQPAIQTEKTMLN